MPSSGRRSFALPGFGGSRRASSIKRRERLVARAKHELVHVDAGRHLVDALDVADDLVEHLADVRRADERRVRARRAPPRPTRSSSGRPRIEYSSSEPCAFTRNGAPLAAPTGPPISTWFANTRSAGSSSRSVAAFASTYARFSPSVKSCRNFGSSPA